MKKEQISLLFLNIIRFATYLSFLTPFIVNGAFFFPFVAPKSLFFMALSEIIFFSWLALITIDKRYRPKVNLVTVALIIYLIVFVLASVFGINLSYSFWSKFERMTGILMLFHLFAFFLVLSAVFSEDDFKKFFLASNLVAILVSIYGLANLENPQFRGGGTIGNESFLGTYLLFNSFFALYLIFKTQGFLKKLSAFIFSFLVLALLMIGVNLQNLGLLQKISAILFMQGARAAKISFYCGLLLFFLLWLILTFKNKLLRFFATFVLIFSIIFGFYSAFSLIFEPQGFIRKIAVAELGNFGGRFPVWESSVKAIKEKPWLGWGPENFEFAFLKYFNPCLGMPECGGEVWFDRAHNIILDTLVSTGILGMIAYFLIFFSLFFILLKNYLKNKISFFTVGIFISLLVSYFIQNLTVFDMISSYLMFFLVLAFAGSLEKERKFLPELKEKNSLILAIIFIFFIISFVKFIILPAESSKAVIYAIKSPSFSEEQLNYYKKALSLSNLGKFQIRQFFTENFINSIESSKVSSEEKKKEAEFLIEELEKSTKECPFDYRSYLRLGQLLTVSAQFDLSKLLKGEEVLRKAIEISPTNQQGYWSLAQNLVIQNKSEEAIELLEKAVALEPRFESSHTVLIQFLKALGKNDLARLKYEEAIKINPDWEERLKNL